MFSKTWIEKANKNWNPHEAYMDFKFCLRGKFLAFLM